MTVVLAYTNRYMSVIMSDDRINYGRHQEFGYIDGTTKLIELPNMGWISGAGLSDYLDKLKDSLANLEPTNTDEIKEVYKKVIEKCKDEDPDLAEDIDESVAVVSWISSDTKEIFFRVGVLSAKHFGEKLMILQNGHIFIAYPGDYLDNPIKAETLEKKYNLHIGEELDFYSILKNMFEIFKEIALDSKYVSNNCDVGIQVLQQDGIYKLKISGDIFDLLNKVNNNKLDKEFKVVNVFSFF
ncbi:hypothetical protein [Saccharococcus caldoxylosilyticus]|jgi:hypothetical protein|uniref:Uncharacterized protein n=1 Tax=Saccharococcus caldoxylosilyticus TaxID=81408 RepID=A0A150L5R3_9BACL|nr:hypothetical protein [Parageobacillus caldoxylosilyticus]KYD07648.1 hypothetical protein B4119_3399 [Parageobacillus caldoxylosilyticus]